jgi:hypothetical protein
MNRHGKSTRPLDMRKPERWSVTHHHGDTHVLNSSLHRPHRQGSRGKGGPQKIAHAASHTTFFWLAKKQEILPARQGMDPAGICMAIDTGLDGNVWQNQGMACPWIWLSPWSHRSPCREALRFPSGSSCPLQTFWWTFLLTATSFSLALFASMRMGRDDVALNR